jgi:hypothetical protein
MAHPSVCPTACGVFLLAVLFGTAGAAAQAPSTATAGPEHGGLQALEGE